MFRVIDAIRRVLIDASSGKNKMREIKVITERGTVLTGVLFSSEKSQDADTVMIAITGIHGNFQSNPFYYNFGDTLNENGFDFIYAQTNDAYGAIKTVNMKTKSQEIIGSWNERFSYTDEDIEAYINFAIQAGYKKIILAGHSLGANKVIYYLSRYHDERVYKFFLLSPANLTHMMTGVTEEEKFMISQMVWHGDGNEMLPFLFMGWVRCIADTAYDWLYSGILDNVFVESDGDFSQCENITHSGALLIGTYDNFTYGDPAGFLRNINNHIPTAKENKLIFIEGTGHTYQQKEQETAERIAAQIREWTKKN